MSRHSAGSGRDGRGGGRHETGRHETGRQDTGRHETGRHETGRYEEPPTRPRRKRVVLADSRAPVTVLRTVVELEEQTSYGEELVRQFIGIQLRTALKAWGAVVLLLGSLPALFFLFPQLSDVTFAGVRLPWLLLGVAPFPLLFGVGYVYNVVAERNERDFVAAVEK